MDPRKLFGNVPLITKEGYIDPAHFPIESVLKQALSDDDQEFITVSRYLGHRMRHYYSGGAHHQCESSSDSRVVGPCEVNVAVASSSAVASIAMLSRERPRMVTFEPEMTRGPGGSRRLAAERNERRASKAWLSGAVD